MASPCSALTGPVPGAPARGLPRLALSVGVAILLGAMTTGAATSGTQRRPP